ncbi:MAG: DEAD/DEAH box helicase family protein [Nitrospirae bacterium]|nr:DEAD/DEAH box helicase family protein [Nitrospirota bacterium]
MQFKFDGNQEYQIHAIEAVADLLEGQAPAAAVSSYIPMVGAQASFLPPEHKGQLLLTEVFPGAVGNPPILDEAALLKNLQAVQTRNGIQPDTALACIEETIDTATGPKAVRFPNFSVEMETGTGKTYVYLRTALELFRRYGLRKFIIVVPSVAIREGVIKTLDVTQAHLRELYGNTPYRYYVYDSENLSQVRQFSASSGVELMVMTIDSFNKATNVIRQMTDRLQGETPIHLVQAVRPVLILDEPQNMESELRVKALSALYPLFALRYSATHRNPYNVVYRLTPYEAYRQGLVKRIEVASVVKENDANQVFLRLDGIKTEKKTITARIAIHKLMKTGIIKEQIVTVRPGDSMEEKSGRPEYAGFDLDEINPGGGFVRFANNVELKTGESRGADKEAIFEAQIRYTIEEHFRKQAKLKQTGIKVLSLFFIDRVDNYARENGIIRQSFTKAFNQTKAGHLDWKDVNPERVQAAYFAQKRRKSGEVDLLDTVTGKTKEDEAAYDLIMKDKERLLSFEEPVSFIFSHSALREGWDNPNIFQICTLNQTVSAIKKRQEVGRGVRLAVDQTGDRVKDEKINVLTVVANESYERYVERLQAEIVEEYGLEGLSPKPADARKRGAAKLRKQYILKPEFRELWERIKHKTRYAVKINTEKLLNEVVLELDKAEIRPPRVTITKAQLQVGQEDAFDALQISAERTAKFLTRRNGLPNLIEIMANLMEHTTPPMRLTRTTLLEIFKRAKKKRGALDNPYGFATAAVQILKGKLADHLVNGIQYQKINEWYEMTQWESEIPSWKEYLVPSCRSNGSDGASLYDNVIWESEIEKKFAEDLEKLDFVKLYVKLPSWFTVDTPVGTYNPDWAIVMEERDPYGKSTGKPFLYLVRETKDRNWKTELRPDERRKILCGERHFKDALGVDYQIVTKASELH